MFSGYKSVIIIDLANVYIQKLWVKYVWMVII